MTTLHSNIAYAKTHPVKTGIVSVLGILALGVASGFAFGFGTPATTNAQLIVTAHPIVVVPQPVIIPVVPIMVVPIAPPQIIMAPVVPPADVVVTAPASNPDTNTPPIEAPVVAPTPVDPVVITAPSASPDTNTPPCCTTPSGGVSPTPDPLIITAPTGSPDTNTPPCCTDVTPANAAVLPITPVVPPSVDVNTPPCCTVVPIVPATPPIISVVPPVVPPIVPPVVPPVIPPVIPPIVPPIPSCLELHPGHPELCSPPVPPQPSCDVFSGTPSTINPGDAVTLAWKTTNATSITIDQGVGAVTPVAAGSTIVNPTVDTTYTATVANAVGHVTCAAPVHVTSIPNTPVPACVLLSADKTTINPGETVNLTWATSNASSTSIDNGVGVVTPTAAGSTTVSPLSSTTYTASVPGAVANTACVVSVTVTTGGGGCTNGNCGGCTSGSCGGGGGGPHPNVNLTLLKAPIQALASVSLTQIPYTGLDLGPIGTVLYWLMLILWSAAAAYLVLFGAVPFALRRARVFGSSVQQALASDVQPIPVPSAHPAVVQSATHAPAHANVHEEEHHESHGPSVMTQILTDAGIIRPKSEASHPAPAPAATHTPVATPDAPVHSGFRAYAQGPVLSIDDIVKGLSRESGHTTPAPIAMAVPAYAAPVESAPIHQEAPMYQEVAPVVHAPQAVPMIPEMAAAIPAEVPSFIEALIAGNRDAVFGTVRQLNQSGVDTEHFMAQTICALDDAYRARIDGTQVHPEIARVTARLATNVLERLVSSLTTAVDSSYSIGVTGIKLALTRALAVSAG